MKKHTYRKENDVYALELLKIIEERKDTLKRAIKKAELSEDTYPEGTLRISVFRGTSRYYQVLTSTNKAGKYIQKENLDLARSLAQKEYSKKFLRHARNELKKLELVTTCLQKSNGDLAYQKLSYSRKQLVSPFIQTNEQYANTWQAKPFKTNIYKEEEKRYDTRKGEKVRSKSEAIIADILYELGIPYKYEQALKLKSGTIRYPDFTLLQIPTRKVFYLEHFGLLDLDDYRKSCIHKLNEYMENNIYLGDNLLITYETEDSPLDIKGIKKMLRDLFHRS